MPPARWLFLWSKLMADIMTIEQMQKGSLNLNTLEAWVEGAPNTTVTTPNGRVVPTMSTAVAKLTTDGIMQDSKTQREVNTELDIKINSVSGGYFKAYDTLANLQAATGMTTGQVAKVMSDPIATNNGDYRYTGSAWVKGYDALTDAKNFTTDVVANNTLQASKTEKDELAIFVDKNGRRTWIEVAKDGGMTDTTKQHVRDTVLTPVNTSTLAYAVTDKHGRVLTSVSKTGEIYPVTSQPSQSASINQDGLVNYNTYPFNAQPDYSTWAFYGSSVMELLQHTLFDALKANIPAIKNGNFYGLSSTEYNYINLTTGGFNGTLTFGGGIIKGSNTGTTVTANTLKYGFPRIGAVAGQLSNGIKGNLSNGVFTATELTSDFVVPSDLALNFIANGVNHTNAISIIYNGKNNLNYGTATWQQVVAAARDVVAFLDSKNNSHTLILSFAVNTNATDQLRDDVLNANKYFKAMYGDRYIDVMSMLLSDKTFTDLGITKTQADIDAIATQRMPPSLARDALHWSYAMDVYVSNYIINLIKQKGWY